MISLQAAINGGVRLSKKQLDDLSQMCTVKCGQETKDNVRAILNDLTNLGDHQLYSRVQLTQAGVTYVAGKDHRSELRQIRGAILGGK